MKVKKPSQDIKEGLPTLQRKQNQEVQQFKDLRPEAIQQKVIGDSINQSLQVKQLQKVQDQANLHVQSIANLPIQQKQNSTGLPDQLKSGVEQLSGQSMDDVKVHYNSNKPQQLQAHAYAQGSDIHLASGQEKHLAHEAWHVVQQKQGRVQPTLQTKKGVNINDDQGLEKEADTMGAKAMQLKMATPIQLKQNEGNKVVQRVVNFGEKGEEKPIDVEPFTKETNDFVVMVRGVHKVQSEKEGDAKDQAKIDKLQGFLDHFGDGGIAILTWAVNNIEETFTFSSNRKEKMFAEFERLHSAYLKAVDDYIESAKALDRWKYDTNKLIKDGKIISDDLAEEIKANMFDYTFEDADQLRIINANLDEIEKSLIKNWQGDEWDTKYDELAISHGASDLEKGVFAENKKRWETMHKGNVSAYTEMPDEDGADKDTITHVPYLGLKSCVLQGVAMAFEGGENNAKAKALHDALLHATEDNPWIAFKNYTSDVINPFLFTWLGLTQKSTLQNQKVEELGGEGDGWYVIGTAGHVEAVKVTGSSVAIYPPYQANERNTTTKQTDRMLAVYKVPSAKSSEYNQMISAGEQ